MDRGAWQAAVHVVTQSQKTYATKQQQQHGNSVLNLWRLMLSSCGAGEDS